MKEKAKRFTSPIMRRPGLAYQHAFDWVAVQTADHFDQTVHMVSTPFHAVEMMRRHPQQGSFQSELPAVEEAVQKLGGDSMRTINDWSNVTAVSWIEPRRQDADMLSKIFRHLPPKGQLYVVVGGLLSRFLAERRTHQIEGEYWSASAIHNAFTAVGFQLQTSFGLHGLEAVAWHYLGELCGRINRDHWRDRCHYGMRRAFITSYNAWRPAALICQAWEKPA